MTTAKYLVRPLTPALFNMGVAALFALATALSIVAIFPVSAWSESTGVYWISGLSLIETIWRNYQEEYSILYVTADLKSAMDLRLWTVLVTTAMGGLAGFLVTLAATEAADTRDHYDGPMLLTGGRAVRETAAAMGRRQGRREKSIELSPGVAYPRLWRVLNLLIVGAIGSGKTRLILWLLDQLLGEVRQRNSRDCALMIYDTTGEILAGLPVDDDKFAAIHPHRPGGWGWAMGLDLQDIGDMEEAADQAIGPTKEAMWGKGASSICVGAMRTAQAESGNNWGMPEFFAAALMTPRQMKTAFEIHYPVAASLIELDDAGTPSRTTTSLMLTFRASILRTVRPLADAWRDLPPERLFSFADWVRGSEGRQPRIVVVQRSGRHASMSALWIGMAIDAMAGFVGDETFAVSQTRTRTLVLDELATLGNLKRLPELLDTGRNKGIATIAALQDLDQLHVYGNRAKSIKSRFRLKIFGAQTPGPELKELAEKDIGTRRVIDKSYSKTVESGAKGKIERVAEEQRYEIAPIVSESFLAHQLGVRGARVRAVLVGLENIALLEWPIRVWDRLR